jgi:tRNA1(Val) A37 N6-methylase TrmN6
MLCFFLREKEITPTETLLPKELFDENWINENLKENEGYRYYNVIIRNLFFNCLNKSMKERKNFEYVELIKNTAKVKELFRKIPFLNGGLFNKLSGDDFALDNYHFFAEKHIEHIQELDGNFEVEGIVRLLSKYKYKLTLDNLIDQSEYATTIDPEFIGKVFESLLACIDADSKENRRKITGSFYTPHEIVDYMVNESLDAYLQNNLQGNADLLQCKILDLACGSGAFPYGVLTNIMNRIDPDKKFTAAERYRKKLEVMQNVIYGVDIQPMAVQIAALRLFLALVQDIKPDKNKDNYGVEPLPNLETKFICADAIISLRNRGQLYLQSPQVKATLKLLADTRRQHFMANAIDEKERLQKYDETTRNNLIKLLELDNEFSDQTVELLAQWNPYDQNSIAEFFDSQWMFGVEYFDIVIGNPPYNVLDDKIPKKTEYEKIYTNLKSGRMNIYQCFFGKGTELLKDNGTLAFIHPKTLLGDAYFAATRKFLLKEYPAFTIVNIIAERGVFSSVIQSVVISQWNKAAETTADCRIGEVAKKDDLNNVSYLLKPKSELITKHGTLLASCHIETYKIDKKINKVKSLPLNFVTGNAEWNKIKKHLSAKPSANSKQFIYGENIQRYRFSPPSQRVETTFIDGNVNVTILQNLAILTQRTVNVALRRRIIAAFIDPNDFDYPVVCENSTNVFVCENKDTALYILGILNSRLMDFYFRQHNSNTHVSSRELNRLPVINISPKERQPLIKLVKRRLTGINVDDQIDELVYDLYALTKGERKFITMFFN